MTTSHPTGVFAGPPLPMPTQRVCDLVLDRARCRPDRTAVVCGDEVLSYRELAERAAAVARCLADADARRIGITAHRTAGAVVHALGVALSGRSFVFLNPSGPDSALAHIRATAGVTTVLDPRAAPSVQGAAPAAAADASVAVPTGPDDEAYVLYTSGSSGRPKGVSVTHANLASSTQARLAVYEPYGTPVFLLLSPFHFDSSVAGVWGTLAAGGTLVVAREDERRDPAALLGLISRHQVSHLLTVPSFYSELLPVLGAGQAASGSLRVSVCAGESLPQSVIDQHFAQLPEVALGNEYGPTECTVWSTCRLYDGPARSTVGFPIPGTTVHLLDDQLRPVPTGEEGQIALSGPGVAAGYVADPQRTAAKFVGLTDATGAAVRTYLTGDLGRWSERDGLEFSGRLDNEIKIRGVRVTVEAVEEAITAHSGVRAAAVAYDDASSTCFAFVTMQPGAAAETAAVRARVADALGPAVVPDRVLFLDVLPRTAHDKIDRAALLADALRHQAAPPAEEPSDGDLATRIAAVWSELLGVSVPTAGSATFFELGGNSLTVLRLARALGKIAGRPVGVKDVYRRATVAGQVELLAAT
ncbi:non-ribosomal peptide synthetase [Streptomyces sp. NPDC006134]|uniref:non-ribosomal peptide synthetase n=1 Tax=Streptomyces sp. NPDC006134 TaxID=3154467 RepID=UPI003408E813